ncbi:uncharacterized protein L969DRAFT_93936 [Mixia osmundae IAM 14324]|uniref:F-actin-capping protein subunit alpha n=1 Tax=Mixia osmundae (strain CBS 9802 / IAM 14324 / JCM 22182 / KY 12970) TaxID=764103 RepID=G7E8K8_MIXOS|nr:uncharacterized protein L969DRAFT_93936 [Mixia osmundae IAM 14324]KEI40110.1 hypothetical protein L969DRAFT_93936 [Mixia osmundae IAM 14324]GAA99476.1 hypothetical protein E5Q_06175 [Mixia osmundae IAM 14324]
MSEFLLQAPPGELNDVLSDVRAISGTSDAVFDEAMLPTLEQVDVEQLTVVHLPHATAATVLCSDAVLVTKSQRLYIDPRQRQSFAYDPLTGSVGQLTSYSVDDALERLRTALDGAMRGYVADHYAQGAVAVFACGQRPLANETNEAQTGELARSAAQMDEAALDVQDETSPTMNADGVAIDASNAPDAPSPAAIPDNMAQVDDAAKQQDIVMAPFEPQQPQVDAEKQHLYAIHLVGNKYNPENFWTGRWRSSYCIDISAGTISGTNKLTVHYYEQGNVQLRADKVVALSFGASSKSDDQVSKAIVKAIADSERSYQTTLNAAYSELSEKTFKELRRGLPKTRQKLDWAKISSYRLGAELSRN